jgi:TM2 domain-containing membrane protein YozV
MTSEATQAAQGSAATMMRYDANKKSMGVSYLLWFFVGMLGAHRFYNERTGSGIAQLAIFVIGFLLTFIGIGLFVLGALGIWVLIDAFLIPGWVRAHNNRLASSLGA